jgi:hypothetical protein
MDIGLFMIIRRARLISINVTEFMVKLLNVKQIDEGFEIVPAPYVTLNNNAKAAY